MRLAGPGVALSLAALSVVAAIPSASAAPSSANVGINVIVQNQRNAGRPGVVVNGGTATVTRLQFIVGMTVEDVGPDLANVRVRLELPPGLHWGTDLPDESEHCTSTATTADCTPLTLDPNNNNRAAGWIWDVTADAAGSYVLKADVVSSATTDPDTSDNAATATVVVQPAAPAVAVTAGAARVTPARPVAGSTVVARVAVKADGEAARASSASCAARVGTVRATPRVSVALGSVACSVRTLRTAHGKTVRGKVVFSVEGKRLTRAFSARLR